LIRTQIKVNALWYTSGGSLILTSTAYIYTVAGTAGTTLIQKGTGYVAAPATAATVKLQYYITQYVPTSNNMEGTSPLIQLKVPSITGLSAVNYLGFEDVAGQLISRISDSSQDAGRIPVVSRKSPTPTAPSYSLTSGAGSVNAGTHYYAVTFVDQFGETLLGTPVSVTITGSPAKVSLSSIPIGPTGTTARNIYRTNINSSTAYYLVTTINDNSTTTYADTTADASLGDRFTSVIDTSGSRPILPKRASWFADEMIISGATLAYSYTANQRYCFYLNINNFTGSLTHSVWLDAGSYVFNQFEGRTGATGKNEIFIDGVSIGVIDTYLAGGFSFNQLQTLSFTLIEPGYHKIEIKLAGKNSSSGDYTLCLTKFWVAPTAD
jgi:hypothetical protein